MPTAGRILKFHAKIAHSKIFGGHPLRHFSVEKSRYCKYLIEDIDISVAFCCHFRGRKRGRRVARAGSDFLTRKDGIWTYVRWVPEEIRQFDARQKVRQSTGIHVIDDPNGVRARKAATIINSQTEAYWQALARGEGAEAVARYEAARRRARALGFAYAPAADLAAGPLGPLLERLERLVQKNLLGDEEAVTAVLGGADAPAVRLSGLFVVFEAVVQTELRGLSPDQLRKWRNPKKRAIANLIEVAGDKDIRELTRADALDFQDWWRERVLAEDLDVDTANKDFGHINRMIRTMDTQHRLGLGPVFGELRMRGGDDDDEPRAAYEVGFVQTKMLAPQALATLNADARRALFLVADSGLRLSEAVNLGPGTIVLDAQIPHVQVRPDGRRLKTPQSNRDVPLVGAALAAARAQPAGFPRYKDKGASLSATVNKFLMAHGLRPTPRHSFYSLRHTFKDRLRAAEAPVDLVDQLMGHADGKPEYGAGYTLEHTRRWLERIAFTAPAEV